MKIIEELKSREMIDNITNIDKFQNIPNNCGVYIGFDPTAESLHLGNYIQIVVLKRFLNLGYTSYALIGGATGMIGDPSGKSQERNLLNLETIENNKKLISFQLEKFNLKVVDNIEFYKNMNVLTFLRDTGKLLNIGYMLSKESVKNRLETGLSYTEFSYQLLQAWDFKSLYENYNVLIQLGGSDQWGNITSGIEIIRKIFGDNNNAVGITIPLLTTNAGVKFGKTANNALWIDKSKTPIFDLYQYLFNTNDDDAPRLLKWLSFESLEQINKVIENHNLDRSKRILQKELAWQVTKDIHGEKMANICAEYSDKLFNKNFELNNNDFEMLKNILKNYSIEEFNLNKMLLDSKFATSQREIKEFISNLSITINGQKIDNENTIISGNNWLVKKGKNQFILFTK